ncbi:MAG: hypothetical protein Q8N39_09925 [Pelolinea sp.]|nr:hypothetical protein [Pelolinea sp.]
MGPTNVGEGNTLFAGDTLDGSGSHTLTTSINLPGGPSSSLSTSKVCGTPPPPPPPVPGGGVIPVTGELSEPAAPVAQLAIDHPGNWFGSQSPAGRTAETVHVYGADALWHHHDVGRV